MFACSMLQSQLRKSELLERQSRHTDAKDCSASEASLVLADGSNGDNDVCDPGDTPGVASLVYVCSSAARIRFVWRIQSMGGGKTEKSMQIHD